MDFKDIVYQDIETSGIKEERLYESSDIKRQVIKINKVEGYANTYKPSHSFITKEILVEPTDKVSLFLNYHVPSYFSNKDMIEYVLHVNGESVPVVPVNSKKEGIKIIKQSTYQEGRSYEYIIGESIKSLKLEIIMSTEDVSSSPAVSNIKILTGNEVGE